jgi:hypothetical protein
MSEIRERNVADLGTIVKHRRYIGDDLDLAKHNTLKQGRRRSLASGRSLRAGSVRLGRVLIDAQAVCAFGARPDVALTSRHVGF